MVGPIISVAADRVEIMPCLDTVPVLFLSRRPEEDRPVFAVSRQRDAAALDSGGSQAARSGIEILEVMGLNDPPDRKMSKEQGRR